MLFYLVCIGFALMFLERIFPDQVLPTVKGWWVRVAVINLFQILIVLVGGLTWEKWFQKYHIFKIGDNCPVAVSVFAAYFLITFVYYIWHRLRHDSYYLWNTLHQLHHSASRIETITSFYKHPLEIIVNSLLIGFIVYIVLGANVQVGAWVTLLTCIAEYFYHMNIKTPHWVGYFIQRPEMHRIHHKKGHHYQNFADLPLWDMIFGTYYNPMTCQSPCGFTKEREQKFLDMLFFRNVNNPTKPK